MQQEQRLEFVGDALIDGINVITKSYEQTQCKQNAQGGNTMNTYTYNSSTNYNPDGSCESFVAQGKIFSKLPHYRVIYNV